jgi:predicted ATPase
MTQKGAALVGCGDAAAGVARLRQGLAELRRAGDRLWLPFYGALLATAPKEVGGTAAALRELDEALVLAGEGERVHEAEVHRVAGELLLTVAGRRCEAEARLRRALEVARAQRARSWELRAAAALARAWAERGERGRARDLLAPVYRSFGEGSGTPDLEHAKALLDALR